MRVNTMKTIALILLTIAVTYSQSKPIAVVLKARGTVSVVSNGSTKTVKRGTRVMAGDVVKSGGGSSYAMLRFLDDKSTLRIRKNSSVKIQGQVQSDNSIAKNVILEVGDVFASVVQQKGDFRVSTPTSVASVKGTKFQSVFDPATGEHITYLMDGLVGINIGGSELDLTQGNAIKVNKDGTYEIVPESELDKFGIVPFDDEAPTDEIEVEFRDANGNLKTIKIKVQDN